VANSNANLQAEWKKANDRVREAEERLGAAWVASEGGKGDPPGEELIAEVARLRRECDRRLTALLELFSSHRPTQEPKEHPGG